ncbi:unnamed protein product, partial [marine sediment metagenome]
LLDENLAAMAARAGASEAALQKMADTTAFEMGRFRAEWTDLMRDIGTSFMEEGPGRWYMELAAQINLWRKAGAREEAATTGKFQRRERMVDNYLVALGEIRAVEWAMTLPKYQQIDLTDRLTAAQEKTAKAARAWGLSVDEAAQLVGGRLREVSGHAIIAAKALEEAVLKGPARVAAEARAAAEAAAGRAEVKRVDDFVAALEKLLQEQIEVARAFDVAAGVYSEVDARLNVLAETADYTADELEVLREKLQEIFDLQAA